MKKLSVRDNNVPVVLLLNTLFGTLLLSPVLVADLAAGSPSPRGRGVAGHAPIAIKAAIVLGSWVLGYFAIKHLPLTIQGSSVNASRPVMVLVGAVFIFGERLNLLIPVVRHTARFHFGFFLISRIGARGRLLAARKPLAVAVDRRHLPRCRKRLVRQIPSQPLRAALQVRAWYSLYQLIPRWARRWLC